MLTDADVHLLYYRLEWKAIGDTVIHAADKLPESLSHTAERSQRAAT